MMPFASQKTTTLALSLLLLLLPQGLERNDVKMKGSWEPPDGLTSRDVKLLWRRKKKKKTPTELCTESLREHPMMLCCHTPCHVSGSCDLNAYVCIRQWQGCLCIYCPDTDGVRWQWLSWLVCVSAQQSTLRHFMHWYVFCQWIKREEESLECIQRRLYCHTANCSGCFWWKDIFYIRHRESHILFLYRM